MYIKECFATYKMSNLRVCLQISRNEDWKEFGLICIDKIIPDSIIIKINMPVMFSHVTILQIFSTLLLPQIHPN